MCKITKVDPTIGAYVTLLEYDDIEGMIMASECSKKRIRSVANLLKVGKLEELLVQKVDPSEGCIDLSRKRLQLDDKEECRARFNHARKVNNIVR